MPVEVLRTYLEMKAPAALAAAPPPPGDVRIAEARGCTASFYRYLYAEVGRDYRWTDRLGWTDAQILAHLSSGAVTVHVVHVEGTPAGYFELTRHDDGSCELSYFGLLPEFKGRGLGKYLLTRATEEAWKGRPTRVWLHTCTLDDKAALPNYQARGFTPYRTETYFV